MPCYCPDPVLSNQEYLENMLCQAFKFLNAQQIMSIRGCPERHNAYQWYCSHLVCDFSETKDEEQRFRLVAEAQRMGRKLYINDDGYATIE